MITMGDQRDESGTNIPNNTKTRYVRNNVQPPTAYVDEDLHTTDIIGYQTSTANHVQFTVRPQTSPTENFPTAKQTRFTTQDGTGSPDVTLRQLHLGGSGTPRKPRIRSSLGRRKLHVNVNEHSQMPTIFRATPSSGDVHVVTGTHQSLSATGPPNRESGYLAARPHTSHAHPEGHLISSRKSTAPDTPVIQNRWTSVSSTSRNMVKAQSNMVGHPKAHVGHNARGSHQEWKKFHTVHQVAYRDPGENTEPPREKLIRILKGLRIIVGFCLALKRYSHGTSDVDTMLEDLEKGLHDSHAFSMMDINLDKLKESGVSKPVKHLGQRLRSILYIPPEKRSMEDVRKIFVFLRMLPTFRNWTISILLNFCKYAVYQKYQPKQVIIRRGHNPEGYYIILSGTVLVNEWTETEDNRTSHTAFEQTCGDIFGDKELVENLPRQSTVVCRTECELLTASREDYLEVVSGPSQQIMDENIGFLRELQLFEHFPCQKLSDALAEYSVKLYSKDSVVVPASDLMTNLIIVKSGKCKVVGEIIEKTKTAPATDLDLTLRTTFPKEYKRRHITEEDHPHTSLELEWETGEMRGVMRANLKMGVRDPERLVLSAGLKGLQKRAGTCPSSQSDINRIFEKLETKKALLRRSQTEVSPPSQPSDSSEPHDRFVKSADVAQQDSETKSQALNGISRRLRRISRMTQLQQLETKKQEISNSSATGICNRKRSQFVVLDRLEPGSVFGLETVFFQCPLRLSLVSEGAECISISKKFFVRECNQQVLKAASEVLIRYPSVVYIRKKVEEKRAWEKYKRQLVSDVLRPRLESRESTRLCMT